jgi:hypothetical protein
LIRTMTLKSEKIQAALEVLGKRIVVAVDDAA